MSGTQPENDGIIPQKSLTVGMGWEKRGMFRNVKALILNDLGTWRRGGNHTTTISRYVSDNQRLCTKENLPDFRKVR